MLSRLPFLIRTLLAGTEDTLLPTQAMLFPIQATLCRFTAQTTPMANLNFNVISWNSRGLAHSPVKRTRCLEFLHRKGASIALIQEAHLKQEDAERFQNKNYKVLACFCALNKSKGVLMLRKRSLNLSVDTVGGDEHGRFVYAAVTINNSKFLLTSIYAPNEYDKFFLDNICKT